LGERCSHFGGLLAAARFHDGGAVGGWFWQRNTRSRLTGATESKKQKPERKEKRNPRG
jgi:hypothetical protein